MSHLNKAGEKRLIKALKCICLKKQKRKNTHKTHFIVYIFLEPHLEQMQQEKNKKQKTNTYAKSRKEFNILNFRNNK